MIRLTTKRRYLVLALCGIVLVPLLLWYVMIQFNILPAPGKAMFPPFNMSDRIAKLDVEEVDGKHIVVFGEGEERTEFGAEEFLAEVKGRQEGKGTQVAWLFRVLDITSWQSMAWVTIGLVGQAVFAGRMFLQWLAAEKAKAAVVPPIFWWMSLIGSSMLIIYFIWRKEPVGFLGQISPWFIYIRNLWFIYGRPLTQAEEPAES